MMQGARLLASFALALVALLLCAAPLRADGDHLAAARGIGDYLVSTARREGEAVRWAQYEGPGPDAMGEARHYPVTLYSGTAGTGFFLLNLYRATRRATYLAAARGAGLHLLQTATSLPGGGLAWEGTYERKGRSLPEGKGLGLYVGNAGVGLFLEHLHGATKEARFGKGAEGAFARILSEARAEGEGRLTWERGAMDIISGEAGIGLALLEMHRLTGETKYRVAAEKAAAWLVSKATQDERGVRWERHGWSDAGFSHGASGIAFFLLAVGGDANFAAARGAARWIASVARRCGAGAVLWDYYAGSPPEGKRDWVMNSWCHGAPGTIRLFLLLHATEEEEAPHLQTATAGGGGIRHELHMGTGDLAYFNPSYCCGAAGCIDAFLDLYQATGDAQWLAAARAVADDLLPASRTLDHARVWATYDAGDRAAKKHPYVDTGFMHGNAGVGHALLRLALLVRGEEGKLLLLPDHPFSAIGRP